MGYTGGELNILNGKMGTSSPNKTVPVLSLIKKHKPKSKDALVQLIEYHKLHKCECGIISKGTVKEFGEWLYNSQEKYWGEYKYTLIDCIQWMYDLFIVNSLKGEGMEEKALHLLKNKLEDYLIEEAVGYLDEELRIDLVIYDSNKNIICGIQVKPKTFNYMRDEVLFMQKKQNLKWGYPVLFLYYNKDESFNNLDSIVSVIKHK
jgi:hypothetical protein